jgi:hypothetical protein
MATVFAKHIVKSGDHDYYFTMNSLKILLCILIKRTILGYGMHECQLRVNKFILSILGPMQKFIGH